MELKTRSPRNAHCCCCTKKSTRAKKNARGSVQIRWTSVQTPMNGTGSREIFLRLSESGAYIDGLLHALNAEEPSSKGNGVPAFQKIARSRASGGLNRRLFLLQSPAREAEDERHLVRCLNTAGESTQRGG
jgi:hypothetical protein